MTMSFEKRSSYFLTAFFLINFVAAMLLLATVSFVVSLPLSRLHFPVAFILAASINYFACKHYFPQNKFAFLKIVALVSVLIIVSLALANYFYDTSYDGQWYHQETLIQLKNGWNPFTQHLPIKMPVSIWLDHYAKGAEIPEAVIYTFFSRIEMGKAVNLILLFAAFCLSVGILAKINTLTSLKIYLIAALLTFNPVFVAQLFTYYVDIQLGLLMLCLLLILCSLQFEYDKYKLVMLCVIICITLNIKFTSLPYAGSIVIGALVILFLRKQIDTFRKVFIGSAVSAIIGLLIIGYNPYIKNTVEHGNPFYPLAGKGKLDIMLANSPPGFPHNNRFYNVAISFFSRTSGGLDLENSSSGIKLPFTFSGSELIQATDPDARLGGFGFLFSGILILSVLLLIIVLIKSTKENKFWMFALLIVLLISAFSMEYSWWARYTPQFWFIPLVILFFSELVKSKPVKLLGIVIYGLLLINVSAISAFVVIRAYVNTQKIDYDLALIKSVKNNVKYVDFGDFKPERVKFEENGIKFISHSVGKGIVIDMKSIFTKVELKKNPVPINEPFGMKLYKKLYKK